MLPMIGLMIGLALGQPAPVKEEPANVAGWQVTRGDHDCRIGMVYDRMVVLSIRFDARLNQVTMIVSDPAFQSLRQGDAYPIDVHFLGRRNQSYPGVTFMPMVGGDAPIHEVAALFDRTILDDLSASESVMALKGNAIVANLPLQGSSAAIVALRRCAVDVAQSNPSDPLR